MTLLVDRRALEKYNVPLKSRITGGYETLPGLSIESGLSGRTHTGIIGLDIGHIDRTPVHTSSSSKVVSLPPGTHLLDLHTLQQVDVPLQPRRAYRFLAQSGRHVEDRLVGETLARIISSDITVVRFTFLHTHLPREDISCPLRTKHRFRRTLEQITVPLQPLLTYLFHALEGRVVIDRSNRRTSFAIFKILIPDWSCLGTDFARVSNRVPDRLHLIANCGQKGLTGPSSRVHTASSWTLQLTLLTTSIPLVPRRTLGPQHTLLSGRIEVTVLGTSHHALLILLIKGRPRRTSHALSSSQVVDRGSQRAFLTLIRCSVVYR